MLIGAVATLTFAGVAFAQEVTVHFENELSSDVDSISDESTEFAGFANQVTVELESAYVEFTPVEMLSIDLTQTVLHQVLISL